MVPTCLYSYKVDYKPCNYQYKNNWHAVSWFDKFDPCRKYLLFMIPDK